MSILIEEPGNGVSYPVAVPFVVRGAKTGSETTTWDLGSEVELLQGSVHDLEIQVRIKPGGANQANKLELTSVGPSASVKVYVFGTSASAPAYRWRGSELHA
jgi:hypothetical protein